MAEPVSRDPGDLSYEEARDELIQVVTRLEQGGTTLEDSLTLWERGEALATRCEEWLVGARKRLEAARTDAADAAGSAPEATADPGAHA